VYAGEIVEDCQSGFRKNKSTTNYTFLVRQVIEKHYEYVKYLHMLFVSKHMTALIKENSTHRKFLNPLVFQLSSLISWNYATRRPAVKSS